MNKILFSLATITILSAGMVSQAQAAPRGHSYVQHGRYANYNINYGTRFAYGYYYPGRNHYHWTYSQYDARYGCTCYYDPSCSSWYYWCAPASCYYPVSYCPYRTYCWGPGGCGAAGCGGVRTPFFNVQPGFGQGPIGPGGPAGPGPNGPVGPRVNGPAIPAGPNTNGPMPLAPNGPVGPMAPAANGPVGPMAPAVNGPVGPMAPAGTGPADPTPPATTGPRA